MSCTAATESGDEIAEATTNPWASHGFTYWAVGAVRGHAGPITFPATVGPRQSETAVQTAP